MISSNSQGITSSIAAHSASSPGRGFISYSCSSNFLSSGVGFQCEFVVTGPTDAARLAGFLIPTNCSPSSGSTNCGPRSTGSPTTIELPTSAAQERNF
ncbi:hypothetical protein Q3G72_015349 [Acer saccharum]|nr:hypothetical protein Q3G72_015349 [Acer saccharum]